MNGIVHPCCHPENKPAPNTEKEMFQAIFEYTDHIFSMIRPRRLLYLAIDGVAPRAKMNQQRARRFRAAQEAEEKARQQQQEEEEDDSDEEESGDVTVTEGVFDSNCITPGTPFMANLSRALRWYVQERISKEPAWQASRSSSVTAMFRGRASTRSWITSEGNEWLDWRHRWSRS